jgi:eukaryotic-like serine/threonine-protein kinase
MAPAAFAPWHFGEPSEARASGTPAEAGRKGSPGPYNPRQLALTPGTRLGPYEILSALGAGGMGEVYRARDTKLGRDVAIKVLPRVFTADRSRLARFAREARLLAALNHPRIGAIYGFEETTEISALVLELIDGPTLADVLTSSGPTARAGNATGGQGLPVRQALSIATQIAEALEVAHAKGIVHRDLKPANVKITAGDCVKVLDFGLAKEVVSAMGRDDGSAGALPTVSVAGTHEGTILGTVAYMSPE